MRSYFSVVVTVLASLALAGVLMLAPSLPKQAGSPVLVPSDYTCLALGYPNGFKTPPTSGTYSINGVDTVTINRSGESFSWSSTLGMDAVVVRHETLPNVYVYDPPAESFGGSGLHAPIDPSTGQPYTLTHIEFCYDLSNPTSTASSTATLTPTATDTAVPTNTATDTPTITPTNTATDTPTNTTTPPATNTPTDTPTSSPEPNEPSATPTNTPTVGQNPSATPTNTPTVGQNPSATPTNTVPPGQNPSATPTNPGAPSPTATNPGPAAPTATSPVVATQAPVSNPLPTSTFTPSALCAGLSVPSLAMTAAPAQALPGTIVKLTVQVGNPNSASIPAFTTSTSLAAAAEFVSASSSQGQASYDAATHSVVMNVATLPAGGTVTLTIEVRLSTSAPAGSQVTAITRARLGGFDCISAATNVTVTPAGIPVTGYGPGPRELMAMGLAGVGVLSTLLLAGWLVMRRAVRRH